MKCKVLCLLLCVLFCFSCFSLNSSAVEVNEDLLDRGWVFDGECHYLPYGVYDPYLYGPMTLISTEPHFPDFDVNKIPWSTAPDYITKYIYMPFKWDASNYEVPFVMVRVTASRASVFVGYNLGLGYDTNKECYRVCSPFFTNSLNSVCYYAQFNPNTYQQITDWQQLEPVAWGNTGLIVSYGSNIAYNYTQNDYYFYGGAGVRAKDTPIASCSYSLYSSGYDCIFQSNSVIGFQSGLFFYNQSDDELLPYGQYFVPRSAASVQAELQQEEVKTSKSIWETLKSIPDMIADKFVGLFVPSDGYFDDLISEFESFFKESLGILYELPESVIRLLSQFLSFRPLTNGYYISIPEVTIPIMLEDGSYSDFTIFEAQDYRFDFLSEGAIGTLYTFYRSFCWLVCIFSLISFATKVYTDITDE